MGYKREVLGGSLGVDEEARLRARKKREQGKFQMSSPRGNGVLLRSRGFPERGEFLETLPKYARLARGHQAYHRLKLPKRGGLLGGKDIIDHHNCQEGGQILGETAENVISRMRTSRQEKNLGGRGRSGTRKKLLSIPGVIGNVLYKLKEPHGGGSPGWGMMVKKYTK